jgi:hypothetical protein
VDALRAGEAAARWAGELDSHAFGLVQAATRVVQLASFGERHRRRDALYPDGWKQPKPYIRIVPQRMTP